MLLDSRIHSVHAAGLSGQAYLVNALSVLAMQVNIAAEHLLERHVTSPPVIIELSGAARQKQVGRGNLFLASVVSHSSSSLQHVDVQPQKHHYKQPIPQKTTCELRCLKTPSLYLVVFHLNLTRLSLSMACVLTFHSLNQYCIVLVVVLTIKLV